MNGAFSPDAVRVVITDSRNAVFGTGQRVRVVGEEGEFVVVVADDQRQVADLLFVSGWPSKLETDVPFSKLDIVVDRRSPSARTVVEPIGAQYSRL